MAPTISLKRAYVGAMAVVRAATYLILLSLVVSVLAGVTIRYLGLFNGSLFWVDELSRFSTIWMVMLGSAVALEEGAHVAIEFLPASLPPRLKRLIEALARVLSALCMAILTWYGLELALFTMRQISPSLGIPMGYVYLAIPVSSAIMLVQLVLFALYPSLKPAAHGPGTAS
jgi:TRAP-type C4-dicarboxylate transport system permease small subunit